MTADSAARGYDDFYKAFDSPLMRRLRVEAYGKDIGQHSWVTAAEVLQGVPGLGLTAEMKCLGSRQHRLSEF